MKLKGVLLFLFLATLLTSTFGQLNQGAVASQVPSLDFSQILKELNMTNVQRYAQFFSSLKTRNTGSLGSLEAAEYIYDKFNEYGLENVSYHEYPITNTIDHGANLTLLTTNEIFRIYPVRPNKVIPSTTPPKGITGHLIYVEDGALTKFDGQEVNGSIVLMDWYGEENFLTAAKLGAKAVIFISPSQIFPNRPQPEVGQRVEIPLQLPRFYIQNAEPLLNHLNEDVHIVANTRWENFTGKNVVGFIKGETDPDIIVLLTSYYDSGRVVPSLAPGAQEATGVSSLLEIARCLSLKRPRYTVMFTAFSGHHQSIEGSIWFSSDYLQRQDPSVRSIGEKIWFWFNLDFSTGSDKLALMVYSPVFTADEGGGASYGVATSLLMPVVNYFRGALGEINKQMPGGRTYHVNMPPTFLGTDFVDWMLNVSSSGSFLLDNAPSTALSATDTPTNGIYGYSFMTIYDPRPYYGTPFDTLDKIGKEGWANLQTQLETSFMLIRSFLSMDRTNFENRFKQIMSKPTAPYKDISWAEVVGKVGEWNVETNWYKPVPNAIVRIEEIHTKLEPGGVPRASPWLVRYVMTDKNGEFRLRGGFSTQWRSKKDYLYEAYVVNASTGELTYSPDQGTYARLLVRQEHLPEASKTDLGWIPVFKSATIAFFDAVNPDSLSYDWRGEWGVTGLQGMKEGIIGGYKVGGIVKYTIYEGETLSPATFWGDLGTSTIKQIVTSIIAVEPQVPVYVKAQPATAVRYPVFFLNNATSRNPYGEGYILRSGQQLVIPFTSLVYAQNLYLENEESFRRLIAISGVETASSGYNYHKRSEELIQKTKDSLKNHQYSEAFSYEAEAWSLAREAYLYSRGKIEDMVVIVPFFAFLIIPFVVLFERLLFKFSGTRKLVALIVTFAFLILALNYLHPSFSLAANPTMTILGACLLILLSPIMVIMFGRVSTFIQALRIAILGRHEAEISRGSEMIYSFSTGLENMRRRKFRSVLTLVSITLMVTALVSFASISVLKAPAEVSISAPPIYDGIYIHRMLWGEGTPNIGLSLLSYLKAAWGDVATIAPRAWMYTIYGSDPPSSYPSQGFRATLNDKEVKARVFLGLSVEENDVTNLWELHRVGGRWFIPTDHAVCILNEKQAEALGIDPNKLSPPPRIKIEGYEFGVVGVISSEYASTRDIDGEEITPVIIYMGGGLHHSAEQVFILKFEDVMQMGGEVASISMRFTESPLVHQATESLREKLSSLTLWRSVGGAVVMITAGLQVTLVGFTTQSVAIALVALSIFNITLGTVHERKKEIYTYSTIGLSPLHISFLFLAELATYAFLGGVIGYMTGLFMTGHLSPGTVAVNYSSSGVMTAVMTSMLIVILSSIYPVIVASRMVTPSLKRVWKIPTKPKGDLWEISLPFQVATEEGRNGVIAYIEEYLKPHIGERVLGFSAENISLETGEMKGIPVKGLGIKGVRIEPYERGVIQEVKFLSGMHEDRWKFYIVLQRIGGTASDWERLNWKFVDGFRKQLLLWGSLSQEERDDYIKRFHKTEKGIGGEPS